MIPIVILLLLLLPANKKQGATGIGRTKSSCTHKVCGTCGGIKRKKKIGTLLTEVCSPQCQAAAKDACECKCGGQFHKGANSKLLQKILNPQLAAEKKSKATQKSSTPTGRALVSSFQPETVLDYLALFLYGTRIKTASFDRFADPNLRENKTIALNWLAKNGMPVDTLAKSFVSEYNFGMDEQETCQAIVDFIVDNPDGVAKYIQRSQHARNVYYSQMDNTLQKPIPEKKYTRDELGPFYDLEWISGNKRNKRRHK